MAHAGLDFALDARLFNAVSCAPINPPRRLLNEAHKACSSQLMSDVLAGQHKIIIPMGNEALASVVKAIPKAERTRDLGRSISSVRGGYWRVTLGGRQTLVMPMHHPAFFAPGRSPVWFDPFVRDWQRVGRALRGELQWNPGPALLEPDLADILNFEHHLKTYRGHVACDVETNGVGLDALLLMVGFATSTRAIVVPFYGYDDGGVRRRSWTPGQEERVRAHVQKWLTRFPLLMHNGQFDCRILEANGFSGVADAFLKHGIDTMIRQHILNPEMKRDLGTVASIWTDAGRWKGMVDHG